MSRLGIAAIIVALLTSGLAGCVGTAELEEMLEASQADEQARPTVASPAPNESVMTAEESVEEEEGRDDQAPPFYARRIVTVTGEVLLDRLPALLSTTDGDVSVSTHEGDAWKLVATLEGRGMTADEARQERDRLSLDWTIGTPGNHHLEAKVQRADQEPTALLDMGSAHGDLELVLPQDQLTDLTADTTDGDVHVQDLAADELTADTTDGDVDVEDTWARRLTADTTDGDVDVEVRGLEQATLDTTDGDVTGTLVATRSGSFTVSTTDGDVDLSLPEDLSHGYDLHASSSDGDVEISLEDGTTRTDSDEDDDGGEAWFTTNGYEDRPIRTQVEIGTNDGDIEVRPA